jgi:hypothetical protein
MLLNARSLKVTVGKVTTLAALPCPCQPGSADSPHTSHITHHEWSTTHQPGARPPASHVCVSPEPPDETNQAGRTCLYHNVDSARVGGQ